MCFRNMKRELMILFDKKYQRNIWIMMKPLGRQRNAYIRWYEALSSDLLDVVEMGRADK